MAYRKTTIRKLPPVTREYCRLLNELDSIVHRGKNLAKQLERIELDSRALAHARERQPLVDKAIIPLVALRSSSKIS